ncbi:PREDICTED: N-acetylmuramoyl-L-alanine amidase [Chinchilla lanigera]|uniref:Peptidoglycan recognition protein 2 n=1 Tax=Chinchilla lanigera TaxID=34839 RepID=A0A8C2YP26_CHILA|nr:PREDICTED: N-acetylmuramoyl-L-alanine amidase [Chinchilla lanigera]
MRPHGVLWILLGLLLWPEPRTASLPLVMDSVIQALAELEQKVPGTEVNQSASAWLLSAQSSGPVHPLHHLLLTMPNLKVTELQPPPLNPELQDLAEEVARHDVRDGREYGVVLAPDGSTVAVKPLLAGLTAGLQVHKVLTLTLPSESLATPQDAEATSPGPTGASPDITPTDATATLPKGKTRSLSARDSFLTVTLAADLGLAFLQSPPNKSLPGLGTDGCWDQLSAPQNFTLLDPNASVLTTAFLNGALDGALLADYLSRAPEPQPSLSCLLSEYYGAGVAGDPEFRSNFRRQKGANLTSASSLAQLVLGTLVLLQSMEPGPAQLQNISQEQLAQVAAHAAREFMEAFLGCPAIHPRCRWEAAPYRGRPTPLKLPLGFLYVHHTFEPALPCTTFERCAANMRSMQRFHQDTRGWEDIGYSFVVGSEGYVYEGRGWHWVGAHTRGYNSRGFGVAIVGDYTKSLPSKAAMRTVSDELPSCAVRAGLLRSDYQVLGYRQLVHTDCPGHALFRQLRTWPHFSETGN